MKGILWLTLNPQETPVDCMYQPAKHLHITLQFGVNRADWEHLIGENVPVTVTANCWNDNIQAIRVSLPEKLSQICGNVHPHITISHREGVRPVESNEMLAGEHNKEVIEFVMQTTVEFYEFS